MSYYGKSLVIVMNITARKATFPEEFNRYPTKKKRISKELCEGAKSFAATRRGDFVRPERESKHRESIKLIAFSHVSLTCGEENQVI